jgi:hypothetical protein
MFTVLSVRLTEEAELCECIGIAISVIYICMFSYKSLRHKCDNCLLFQCVVSVLVISVDRGSFSSRSVSLILQIWMRLLAFSGGIYQGFVHTDQ